ncbi:hypothetical protein GQX74_015060 [Glossina fuscipes]|nr:hypothetical protein GQX74_015060 [Glossina fuscipes]
MKMEVILPPPGKLLPKMLREKQKKDEKLINTMASDTATISKQHAADTDLRKIYAQEMKKDVSHKKLKKEAQQIKESPGSKLPEPVIEQKRDDVQGEVHTILEREAQQLKEPLIRKGLESGTELDRAERRDMGKEQLLAMVEREAQQLVGPPASQQPTPEPIPNHKSKRDVDQEIKSEKEWSSIYTPASERLIPGPVSDSKKDYEQELKREEGWSSIYTPANERLSPGHVSDSKKDYEQELKREEEWSTLLEREAQQLFGTSASEGLSSSPEYRRDYKEEVEYDNWIGRLEREVQESDGPTTTTDDMTSTESDPYRFDEDEEEIWLDDDDDEWRAMLEREQSELRREHYIEQYPFPRPKDHIPRREDEYDRDYDNDTFDTDEELATMLEREAHLIIRR